LKSLADYDALLFHARDMEQSVIEVSRAKTTSKIVVVLSLTLLSLSKANSDPG
jgi:hypothetical protein